MIGRAAPPATPKFPLALTYIQCQSRLYVSEVIDRSPASRMCCDAGPAHRPEMGTMQFRPLHDRVVIRRLDGEEKTKGGIIIPDNAKEKPQEGEVVAVGPGGRDDAGKITPLDVKTNDKVLFGKWSGTEIKLDGEDLLIMKESDILGVVA